ncbi:MAG: hypothetical protein RIA69_11620 [Cyclobacteriaceae bacterium]
MKDRKNCVFLLVFLAWSCVEKVDFEQDRFVKILGKEGTAITERIIEMDNGDIMVLGKMGIAAHDITSTFSGPQIGEVEDQAPFIAITDANGNLKFLKMYPLEDFVLKWIDVFNFENKTTFKYIAPLSDGGYALMAQVYGFDFNIDIPGVLDLIDYSSPGDVNFAPILFRLDPNFNVTDIRSFNAGPDWDGVHTLARAVMKPLPNNELGILFGYKISGDKSIGYTFLHLDGDLDTLALADEFDNIEGKIAYDFDLVELNTLKILGGEQDGRLYEYSLSLSDPDRELSRRYISEDGVFRHPNTNEHFVKTLSGGEMLYVYTNPSQNLIIGKIVGSGQADRIIEFGSAEDFRETIRAPRAVYETTNGDLLVYEIIIPNVGVPFGYLHRVEQDGDYVFSIRMEGAPGDVIETRDGNILVATNNQYNGLTQRINLIKMSANGERY